MRKKTIGIVVLILATAWMIPSLCLAAVTVTGVTKNYHSQSGTLVLTTQSQTETTLHISQTVTVYIKTQDEDIAVEEEDTWKFLRDNLLKGTKVTVEKTKGVVTTIWISEVPS